MATESRAYADDAVLTIEETANYLRVSPATVYKLVQGTTSDRLPSVKLGRRRIVVFWQLRRWMALQAGVDMPLPRGAISH